MYLRHTTIKKNRKWHTYWRLVRSVRTGNKVRQETVAYLGELDAEGRAKASALAEHFLGKRAHQRELFEDDRRFAPAKVRLNGVRLERGRPFGHVWLGWKLWQVLGLDEFCAKVLPRGSEFGGADLTSRFDVPIVGLDLLDRQVQADGGVPLAELDGQRQADVSQSDDCERGH